MLSIKDLEVSSNESILLKNINLEIGINEIHLLIGPNGSGKSTLFKAIVNHPAYKKHRGQIFFNNNDITHTQTSDIARLGVFLTHQSPKPIEGIKYNTLIKEIKRIQTGEPHISTSQIKNDFIEVSDKLGLNKEIYNRDININLSGGEQKKSELIQLYFAHPKLCLIDEIDSGLDISAIKAVANTIKSLQKTYNFSMILISHNKEMLDMFDINAVHIIRNGIMIANNPKEILEEIHQKGWSCDICKKYGIECG